MHKTHEMHRARQRGVPRLAVPILLGAALLLALLTVFNEVKTIGLSINETRIAQAWRAGDAPLVHGRLWQRATLALAAIADTTGVPRATGVTMLAVRLAQNTCIFVLLALWLRMQGLGWVYGLFAMLALAWSMTMANHNTHLDVSNYGAVLLTLAAACLLLRGTPRTRAMAGVLALLLVADRTLALPAAAALLAGAAAPTRSRRRPARLGAAIAVVCLLALAPLVAWAPAAPLITACARAFGVVSVLPLIALLRPGACPRAAATLGWLLVPGWLAVHLIYWDVGEPRVWLLPTALVLLPAVMGVVAHAAPRPQRETAHA